MSALPIAVTCGDPAGVGPELLASWLQAHPKDLLFTFDERGQLGTMGHCKAVLDATYGSDAASHLNRARLALFLALAAPEYLVQR